MNSENLDKLFLPQQPWLLRMVCPHSEVTDMLCSMQQQHSGSVLRFFRGKKMSTVQGMFDEFSAALQFPYYFGNNGNAFDECLTDLSWLPATSFALAILDSADLLAKEPTQLPLFISSFERACAQWSTPIALGESWDRPAVSFHLIFHYIEEDTRRIPTEIAKIPDVI